MENAFNSNVYLGNVETALEIIANMELLSDKLDQKFLYPTVSEQLKRNDLSSALEISNDLGFEKHDILISKMINVWNYVTMNQKASALLHLDMFINESKFNTEEYYYLKVQGLIIASYFDDTEEIINRYNDIKDKIKKIPDRHYLDISNVIYEKINQKEAKQFLITYLPNNLDLDFSINNLKNEKGHEFSYYLSKIFYEAGYIVARSKGYLNSIPYFWYSLHIDKNNNQSRLVLSSFFSNINQIDIALDILNGVIVKSPSWAITEFEKSFLYEQKGNISLAISIIENLKKNKRFSVKSLLRISNIYRRNGDYRKSLKIIEEIDTSKSLPEIYYYKSLNLVLLKEWERAIESFDALLEVYPNNAEISNFVGYSLVDRNIKLEEGINLIKFAVNKEPQNGFYIDSLGWAYYQLGEFSKAITYLERALEIEPQEIEITDHLGDAYFKVGRKKEARLVWKRALTLKGKTEILESIKVKLNNNF
ncbi:MAG: tetratricopeptide repeat protein [Candidatus Puniceispirillales bacterium]